MTQVILDISRLISRVRHSTPSGVDRVEMAYARGLLGKYGERLAFAAAHPTGVYGRLKREAALAYLDELERRWGREDGGPAQRSLISVLPWLARLWPTRVRRQTCSERPVYVQVSPHHLTRGEQVYRILDRENARFLCMVHDLIPIEYPEYARPNGAGLHRRRMQTLADHADAVIVNSAATGRSFQPWIERSGRNIAVHVALLGTEKLASASIVVSNDTRPWFVCLGTIEPRKNHLLLLNLWREMAGSLPERQVPRLVIIGRRGWENEQVLDMLDRCPALASHVEEINGCSDAQLSALLRGSRALLMPSFAEGFGMPVAEALSVGVPVVCSDIAAHREVGGDVPDYVGPLDGARWQALILDHSMQGPAHQAQMQRLPAWHEPTWAEHMQTVALAIGELAGS
ncbi:glycosyltransferase involved in cell wall biosynthesis [Novosphingobium hassiacum]|uniref:Glycosyltransferase involved in cell wall biosynthesis n=1 Tax=Novosphingobium hassiacum TaxID=173676 RepID=A0A7W5ZSX5_9SPHN|nr:glycosyltransferase family 1 protein [Novosphingobium hassiacum]MBB3859403.1 glycosyltransferase involved in cell wall biosynthesis [Novosphingobium hassiacum]